MGKGGSRAETVEQPTAPSPPPRAATSSHSRDASKVSLASLLGLFCIPCKVQVLTFCQPASCHKVVYSSPQKTASKSR